MNTIVLLTLAAAQQPAAPAAPPALVVTIAEMSGSVDAKRPSDPKWIAGAKGLQLPDQSEIATGLASSARLVSSDGVSRVDMRAASYLKVTQAALQRAATQTTLELKYGAVEVDVRTTTGRANLMSIRAPNATTSITGTRVMVTALGAAVSPRHRTPAHSHVMFRVGQGTVVQNGGGVTIFVGPQEALTRLGHIPSDSLKSITATANLPYTGFFHFEGGPVAGSLIVEDPLNYGTPFAGLVPGSTLGSAPVTVNQQAANLLPGPPPPPR